MDPFGPQRPDARTQLRGLERRLAAREGLRAAPADDRFVGFMERGIADGVFQNRLDYTFLFSTVLGSMLACKALAGQEAGGERQSGKERKSDSWAENMATLLWPNVCAESAR